MAGPEEQPVVQTSAGVVTNVFPNWARVVLGVLIAFAGYVSAGEVIADEQWRGALSTAIVLVASTGIIPPLPAVIAMPKALSVALTVVAGVGTYVLSVAVDIDPTPRGLIVAAIAALATIGIRPPQVAP